MTEDDINVHLDEVQQGWQGEFIKGSTEIQIARHLGLPRTRVVKHLTEWRGMISNNEAIRARAQRSVGYCRSALQ